MLNKDDFDVKEFTSNAKVDVALTELRKKYALKGLGGLVLGLMFIPVGFILIAPGILLSIMFIIWMNTQLQSYKRKRILLIKRKVEINHFAATGIKL